MVTSTPARTEALDREPLPPPRRWRPGGRGTAVAIGLVGYYTALIGLAILALRSPFVRQAWVAPVLPAVAEARHLVTGSAPPALPPAPLSERMATTALVLLGALLLVLPVAWTYMQTKRLQYDPALVRAVILLPLAVAGTIVIVKSSLALAFGLAGIVAAVRFRNALQDPRDAVYIFLAIAVGLSAGVQALDVALVVSALFNLVAVGLWRFQVGAVSSDFVLYGAWAAGDRGLWLAGQPEVRQELRRRFWPVAEEWGSDGLVLLHTTDAEAARWAAAEVLDRHAARWRLVAEAPRGPAVRTLVYLVELKKKRTATELIGAFEEAWGPAWAAVEYLPFRSRESREADDEDDARG